MHSKDTEKRADGIEANETEFIELRTLRVDDTTAEPETAEEALEKKRREQAERVEAEAFWAGRNHAMRRSGRVAA